MSPLALLQEGEIAEIVDPVGNEATFHSFGHRHCHGGFRFGNPCSTYSCRCHVGGGFQKHGHAHLQDMGLRPGKKVEMITNKGAGPLILRVDECRIALSRGAAMKIYVRRNEQ